MYCAVKLPLSSSDGGHAMWCHLIKHCRQSAHRVLQRTRGPGSHWKVPTAPLAGKGTFVRRGGNRCWAR